MPAYTGKMETLPTTCLCENLRRASRTVTRRYDEALRPLELRITQFSQMSVLAQHEGLRVRDLATAVALDETAALRSLRSLVERKLVVIRTGDDRRERYASLTAAGRALFAKAAPRWAAAQKDLEALLTGPRWKSLMQTLPEIVALG